MIAPLQRPGDGLPKLRPILPEQLGRLVVQRIVRVGVVEEVDEPIDDRVNIKNRLPVLPEDVETDVTLLVDIGVVDLGVAVHLGRVVGVEGRNGEGEVVLGSLPVASVGTHPNLEQG